MDFRPCIDLHLGKVKQIVGSTLSYDGGDAAENFVSESSAAYYSQMFKYDGLRGGHICMLGSGNEEQAQDALKAYQRGMQIGGGINDQNAEFYLNLGASHVIVTSYIFSNGEMNNENIELLVKKVGKEHIVFDLSCQTVNDGKEYYVATDRWTKLSSYKVNDKSLKELENYCDEFLIHSTKVEGKCSGIDVNLLKILGEYKGKNAITYAGGVSSFSDIKDIYNLGKGKINFTIGSALDIFGGKLSYKDVIKYTKEMNESNVLYQASSPKPSTLSPIKLD